MLNTDVRQKPPQGKKSRIRRAHRENPVPSPWCFKKKSRSRYDRTSGVPMFANGAVSGAFAAAFGKMAQSEQSGDGSWENASPAERQKMIDLAVDSYMAEGVDPSTLMAECGICNHLRNNTYGINVSLTGWIGPVPLFVGAAGGGGWSLTITTDGQFALTAHANADAAMGLYGGVGVGLGGYYSTQPISPGTTYSARVGGALGAGPSGGYSADFSQSGFSVTRSLNVGVGVGVIVGGGVQTNTVILVNDPLIKW